MQAVRIDDPPRMNLLGLILASIIERNIAEPEKKARFDKIAADVLVRAGEMRATLRFDRGQLTVVRGEAGSPRAGVSGTMDALMGMALGRGLFLPVLTGRIKISGNPFLLLRIKSLMSA